MAVAKHQIAVSTLETALLSGAAKSSYASHQIASLNAIASTHLRRSVATISALQNVLRKAIATLMPSA